MNKKIIFKLLLNFLMVLFISFSWKSTKDSAFANGSNYLIISRNDTIDCGGVYSAKITLADTIKYNRNTFKVTFKGYPLTVKADTAHVSFKTSCGNLSGAIQKFYIKGEIFVTRIEDKKDTVFRFEKPYFVIANGRK